METSRQWQLDRKAAERYLVPAILGPAARGGRSGRVAGIDVNAAMIAVAGALPAAGGGAGGRLRPAGRR